LASWDYKEISGAITTFYDIRGLTPFTEYEFVVLAVNSVGRGPQSIPVNATTGETGWILSLFIPKSWIILRMEKIFLTNVKWNSFMD
jgi:hypothetical protein